MKIAIIGASGHIGQRITQEALNRNHHVTAIVRHPEKLPVRHANLSIVEGDVLNALQIGTLIAGHDAVVSAYGPPHDGTSPAILVDVAHRLLKSLELSDVKRLLIVGGAGSLEVAPGIRLVDTPEFPAAWKGIALAHADAAAVYQNSNVNYTYFSPAAFIEPGERTGHFRVGTTQLITDEKGQSRISMEDYAVAIIDELERPQFIRKRFTIGY